MIIGLPTPARQIREQLEKLRTKGLSFDLAWTRALERVKWPEEKYVRDEWKAILAQGRSIWEDAYHGRGQPPKGLYAITATVFSPEPSEYVADQLVA